MVERSLSLASVTHLSSVSDVSDTYDHLTKLATVAEAERHLRAKRVQRLKGLDFTAIPPDEVCPCCTLPAFDGDDSRLFSMSTDIRDFAELGVAFPLYFLTLRYLAGMLFFAMIAALPNLICNCIYGNQGYDSVFGRLSIKGTNHALSWWNPLLYLLVLIWLCSFYLITKNRLKFWAGHLQGHYITMADYSVTITGLGKDWERNDLIEHITDKMKVGQEAVQVESITTSYDISELVESVEQYETLRKEKERAKYPDLVSSLCCTCVGDRKSHTELITDERYDREMTEVQTALEKHLDKSHLEKTGVAFVTFATVAQAKRFLFRWGEGSTRAMLTAVGIECTSDPALLFNRKPMHIQRAVEPFDVLWENLGYTPVSRTIRQVVTAVILCGFLILPFMVVMVSAIGNSYMTTNVGYGLPASVVFSLIIVIANKILAIIVSTLPSFECHHSSTGQAVFAAVKVYLVQLFNTLLDPLLLDIVMEVMAPNQASQLADNVTMTCITMVFVETTIDVFPDIGLWYLKKWWITKKLVQGNTFIPQVEANEGFEYPEPEIAIWYGETIVKFIYGLVYCPFAPVVIPITACGLLLEHYIKKWFLVRFCSRPIEANERLPLTLISFIRIGFFLYGISTFFSVYLCLYEIRNGATIVALVCVCAGLLIFLYPSIGYKCCFKWLFPPRAAYPVDYSTESPHFVSVRFIAAVQRLEPSHEVPRQVEVPRRG